MTEADPAVELTEAEQAAIRGVKDKFRELDRNRDGMLDYDELKEFLQKGSPDMTDKDVKILFAEIDKQKSGKVCFSDFVDYVFGSEEVSAQEAHVKAMKKIADQQMEEVQQVQILGATEHPEINGMYDCGEEFNGYPVFDRADPPCSIFYGWTKGRKEVGWFIARRLPNQCPVARYKMFNPARVAAPHLCWTTWQNPAGVLDKRLVVCPEERGLWDSRIKEGACEPEEVWPDDGSDDDSDQDEWEGDKADEAEDAGFDDEWKHEVGEGVDDVDGEEGDYDCAEDDGAVSSDDEKEQFVDKDFPAEKSSIGAKGLASDGWKRLSEMHKKPLLFKKIVSDDINAPTDAPNWWFTSALAAVAEYPAWIQSVFGQSIKVSKNGQYSVRLYHPGKKAFMKITVDDLVPTKGDAPVYLGLSSDGEIWAPILEKAFAKLNGSYGAMQWGSVQYGMLYLCGGGHAESWTKCRSGRWERSVTVWKGKAIDTINRKRAEGITTDGLMEGKNHLWMLLREYMECCYPVACQIDDVKEKESRLRSDRAYSIIGAREVPIKGSGGHLRLLRMRNPFSQGHWTGRWSDGSKAWDDCPAAFNHLRFKATSDGTFWMSYSDFLKYFSQLHVVKKSMPIQGCKRAKISGLKRGLRKFGEEEDFGDGATS